MELYIDVLMVLMSHRAKFCNSFYVTKIWVLGCTAPWVGGGVDS